MKNPVQDMKKDGVVSWVDWMKPSANPNLSIDPCADTMK